ncbi:MAG TPA: hypothetical protein VFM55_24520 [Micromonosporaceae bacterium]|nr:hypothetical protein [Micromonosporaceae bacterium]
MLREAHRQLSLEAFGTERLRFRHYLLADWLMHQMLVPGMDTDDSRAALVRQLRDRRGSPPGADAPVAAEDPVGTVYQFVLWLIRRAIPNIVFRAAVSGRVLLLGPHYRWFMRQQYLAPRQSVTFLGFAERLTAGWRDGEQPEQVNKLLIHAFLEDLRCGYGRRLWQGAAWRRTAYPMLLLNNVAPQNGGHTLVRLINDVRNETGRNDPLLVVAAGDDPPPELRQPQPLRHCDEAYEEWADVLPEARRLRRSSAWFIVLELGEAESGTPPRGVLPSFEAPAPPWWARRIVPAAACLVLLAAGVVWADGRWGPGCYPRPWQGHVAVELVGDECIGYSDHRAHVFNKDPGQGRLRAIQERIFKQNRAAEEVWRASGHRRPLVTLVYFGTLTGNKTRPDEESYASEREELEGMAVLQYALLQESADAEAAALLRVVVANGGKQMRHADKAVAMLEKLARDDPTVLGVVGMVDSRATTAEAIRRLGQAGLPTLAPTLSADGIDDSSKLYLQISAPNSEQAALVAKYAGHLDVNDVHVYYTTGDGSSWEEDLYVKTLVEGLREQLKTLISRDEEWDRQELKAECGYTGLLFFAGRWSDFNEFLRALKVCRDDPPRNLAADDSVNRYMANPILRASAPGNIPLTYVSKAAAATCTELNKAKSEVRRSFLAWVQADNLLDPPRCRPGTDEPVGERVSLAYDAASLVVQAVERLAAQLRHANPEPWDPRAIKPLTVHREILLQNIAEDGFDGVTGLIRFRRDSGTPNARRLTLMKVERITDVKTPPQEIYWCETSTPPAHEPQRRPEPHCGEPPGGVKGSPAGVSR